MVQHGYFIILDGQPTHSYLEPTTQSDLKSQLLDAWPGAFINDLEWARTAQLNDASTVGELGQLADEGLTRVFASYGGDSAVARPSDVDGLSLWQLLLPREPNGNACSDAACLEGPASPLLIGATAESVKIWTRSYLHRPSTDTQPITVNLMTQHAGEPAQLIPLEFHLGNGTTILGLKSMLQETYGLPAHQQRLFYLGQWLADDCTLQEHRVRPGSELHLEMTISNGSSRNSGSGSSDGLRATAGNCALKDFETIEAIGSSGSIPLEVVLPDCSSLTLAVSEDSTILDLKTHVLQLLWEQEAAETMQQTPSAAETIHQRPSASDTADGRPQSQQNIAIGGKRPSMFLRAGRRVRKFFSRSFPLVQGPTTLLRHSPPLQQPETPPLADSEALPSTTVSAIPSNLGIATQNCSICFEPMGSGSYKPMGTAQCGHLQCYECWVAAVRARGECPQCRRKTAPAEVIKLYSC